MWKRRKKKRGKAGWVYIIKVAPKPHIFGKASYKIGITKDRDFNTRFRAIKKDTRYKDKLEAKSWVKDCAALEKRLHQVFESNRVYFKALKNNGATEVFKLSAWEVRQARNMIGAGGNWWLWYLVFLIVFILLTNDSNLFRTWFLHS